MSHKVTNSLLNYLENGNEVDRCYAAKTLGNLKAKEATEALLERIRDEDIDVCIDAISALGKIKEPSALPMLLESLEKDPDSDVKLAVTESLAHYQSKEAIDTLLKLAHERPEGMHFDQNEDWDSWWDLQEKAIVILGEMQVKAAFPVFKEILEDDFSQDIEAIILKALAKLGDSDADEYLINRMNGIKTDSTKSISEVQQRRTATALGFSKTKTTLQALGRALMSQSADTRENVLYALGKRKATPYIKVVVLSLRDPAANVKRAALQVLQDLATELQSNEMFDFNQIAAMLSETDTTLQAAVLAFFKEQHKLNSVIDTLSEDNQNLIHQCLESANDNVLAQAAQLAGVMHQAKSVTSLFKLASSDEHSAWVKKEAILALGQTINAISDHSEKKEALLTLRALIQNEEQAVRSSAIQALLSLSNSSEAASVDAQEDNLPPIAILLATLKGEQFDLQEEDTSCAIGEQASESNCTSCEKKSACSDAINLDDDNVTEAIMQQFEQKDITDNAHLIPSNEEQEVNSAMSTLEAIAMDNVESAQAIVPETQAEKSHDKETGPFISEALDDDMDEFVAIMRKNFSKGKKIIRRKIDTYADARHICARLLCNNKHEKYDALIVNALAECLNDDDEELRQEAAESLSNISLRNPLVPGINNTFGQLVTLLDSNNSDMRLACIHAIAHSGNRAALPHLLDYLSDEDYLIQLHALNGLVYILNNKARLTKKQQSKHMVINEISNEQIIEALFACLGNKIYSVSMAAIEALTDLQQTGAIEQFIDVALTDEGQSARHISKLLKKLDTDKSAELLLSRLETVSDSSYRRYVMEMLEVVVSPEEQKMEAA
ncbi:MAG: HEAT repeat domain-containing protein [Gammaproteobacteria bacterium]|nr:HEAT repeat domain-containing protein [Gammaproteobacteria bacterium]